MFKRANKVTALLVAAASVMSIVPAMATTRLGVKDGHIKEGAIAFEDGKYIYDGYRTDEDNNGIYYNNGTEEKEKLDDELKDYELAGRYGTKYAFATDNNGKDQYLIDLSTGKIVDEETPEDKADTVKSKLKSALKKTDRYSKTGTWDSVDLGDSAENERYDDQTRILKGQFGEVWYLYAAKGDQDATQTQIGTVAAPAKFTIKLPTVNQTIELSTGVNGIKYNAAADLNTLKRNIYAAVVADMANYAGLFDATTVKLYDKDNKEVALADIAKAVTISGQAATAGDLSKTQAFLVNKFITAYNAGTLGLLEFDGNVATTTSGALRLGNIKDAVSSNQTVAVATTSTGSVTITGKNVGTATITVTDSDAKVASVKVNVTSSNGANLKISSTEFAYFSTVEKTVALNNILTAVVAGNDLKFDDFVAIGIPDLVTNNGSDTTLSLAQAKQAIADYIATGKLGAVDAKSLTADNIREILTARLKTLNKQATDTKMVTIFTGSDQNAGSIGNAGKYFGLVNESGKYVDISATANIYVYSKKEGKAVKVKEYNKENDDYGVTVGLQDIKVLAQDKDYFYTLATVSVLEAGYPVETQYFIQKISKAQGDKKDGAYIPKTVDSYQLDNKSIYDDGDAQTAYNLLVSGNGAEDGFDIDGIRVIDGSLYVTGVKADGDNDKVKVFKIALKKAKKDLVSGVPVGRSNGKDVDVYIARKDADTDMSIKKDTRNVDAKGYNAISYDVDGNTWVISKGTITKFEGTNKKDIYTTDRSFTKLDVYNEKNLIAWDTDTDVYTTVGEGTKVTQGEATAVAPAIVTGWVQGTDGTWTFNDAAGNKVTSKWQNLGGYWYYLKADGIMATGWFQDPNGGAWYYLNPATGAMLTGWLKDPQSGLWYYLSPSSGAMLSNTTVDGYQLGGSGAWIQ